MTIQQAPALAGNRSFRAGLLTAAGGIALLSAPFPALAQSADSATADDSGGINEIIVTAQFREENLQDTPIAITAFNAEMLEARSQTSTLDIAGQAPNVTIKQSQTGQGNAATVSIRGIGQGDSSFAIEPGVGIYIDDVYYSGLYGNIFDLLDLDRIEIRRGPQGTLSGKNSIGGSIALFSQRPEGNGEGYVEATGGTYRHAAVRGAIDLAIVPDQLFLRVAGAAKHRDGYVDVLDYGCLFPASGIPAHGGNSNCKLGTQGGIEEFGGRAALRWIASDTLEFNITGDYTISRNEPTATTVHFIDRISGGLPPVSDYGVVFDDRFLSPDNYSNYSTYFDPTDQLQFEPKSDTDSWGVSGSIDLELTDQLSIKSITAYRTYDSDYVDDNDLSPIGVSQTDNIVTHKQFTQEVRLNANLLDDSLLLTVGGFYLDTSSSLYTRGTARPFINFIAFSPTDTHNKSAFVHAEYKITDALSVLGGLRYSKEDKTYGFNYADPHTGEVPPPFAAIDGLISEYEGSRWDYRAVINYRWSPQLMTYAQYSTGYRGGGTNPRPLYGNQVVGFAPEALDAFEVGLKTDLLDRRLRINAALFYNKYSNIQIGTAAPFFNTDLPVQNDPALPFYNPDADNGPVPGVAGTAPASVILNAGKADVKGAEIEIFATPADGFQIDASASYIDFEYTDLLPQALQSGLDYTKTTPYTPKWKASIGAQYAIPLGNAGSLTPRFDYAYQSSQYDTPTNSALSFIEGYGLLNARLTWENENRDISVSAAVTNLTDEYYVAATFDLSTFSGYGLTVPGLPRMWTLSVRKEF
jgi:iron complex outermembrane receptor protein